MRKVFENKADLVVGKFQPNWEGYYMIVKVGAAGSYTLNKLDGTQYLGYGMLCILRDIINEVPFNVFSFDYWNIINQIFFKGIINGMSFRAFSFNSWNSPYIKD